MRHYRVWLSDESKRKEVLDITRHLRFKSGCCFDNATRCVFADKSGSIEYVEGYMLNPRLAKTAHAWCKFRDSDIYFDATPNYIEYRKDANFCFAPVKVYDFEEFHRITTEKMKSGDWWPFPYTFGLTLYCSETNGRNIPFNFDDYTKEAISKRIAKAG